MVSTLCGIVWLCWLLLDMGVFLDHPTPIYCDNKSSIQIAHNSIFHKWTKHTEIDCHVTRHHYQLGTITLSFTPLVVQVSVLFTKAHSTLHFHFLFSKLPMLLAVA